MVENDVHSLETKQDGHPVWETILRNKSGKVLIQGIAGE